MIRRHRSLLTWVSFFFIRKEKNRWYRNTNQISGLLYYATVGCYGYILVFFSAGKRMKREQTEKKVRPKTLLGVVSWFVSHSGIHHTSEPPRWCSCCCYWRRNDDAPSSSFSPLSGPFFPRLSFSVTLLWNRVFDNSLFSSALSGKSSCQQFIQQHLYIYIYIYLIIIQARHPSACPLLASFDMKTFLTHHSSPHPFSSALLTFSYDVLV